MFDRHALALLTPWLNRAAARLAAHGVGADALTLTGFVTGLLAAGLVAPGVSPCGHWRSCF